MNRSSAPHHVEIRFIEYLEHSLLRAGDAMLLALVIDYETDQPPPLLQLHRTTDGGLCDRLLDNLDTIADNAEGPLTAPEQLERYRTNYDDEIEDDEDWTDPPATSHGSGTEPLGPAAPADEPDVPDRDEQSQRRWPR